MERGICKGESFVSCMYVKLSAWLCLCLWLALSLTEGHVLWWASSHHHSRAALSGQIEVGAKGLARLKICVGCWCCGWRSVCAFSVCLCVLSACLVCVRVNVLLLLLLCAVVLGYAGLHALACIRL